MIAFVNTKKMFWNFVFFIGSHPNNDHVFGHVECGYMLYRECIYVLI